MARLRSRRFRGLHCGAAAGALRDRRLRVAGDVLLLRLPGAPVGRRVVRQGGWERVCESVVAGLRMCFDLISHGC